jgi:acyl carrier protein
MDTTTIETEIRQFLTDTFPLSAGGFTLAGGDSLIEAGVVDSTGVLELIEFIEERYGISIPDHDVLPENLDSVDAIVRYVGGRLNGTSEP